MGKPRQKSKPTRDLNTVIFSGRATRSAERRGKTAVFGLAVHTIERIDGEPVEVPFFLEVTVFEPSATACVNYVKKGKRLVVEGNLTFYEYEATYEGGETIYRDEAGEHPLMKQVPRVLTSNVQFI